MWERLRGGIVDALHHQVSYEVAMAAAEALDAGRHPIISTVKLDDYDRVGPFSCCIRIELWHNDEWQGLYSIDWKQLELTLDNVFEMAEDTIAQRQMGGIGPGGPADIGD